MIPQLTRNPYLWFGSLLRRSPGLERQQKSICPESGGREFHDFRY